MANVQLKFKEKEIGKEIIFYLKCREIIIAMNYDICYTSTYVFYYWQRLLPMYFTKKKFFLITFTVPISFLLLTIILLFPASLI